eukprot:CAMPEP_0116870246 /NCGR_PEP_ID=MMETSP0463-20121206/107_1 /TAXON_ID=181622 /ORGANISM="Strombidinopsis sp, Strain SopsisLIS2011" /LENGTH=30 /DNA_ID= /DNA_START= /DNA_END= /DNA_ORIENTATION=
MKGNQTSKNFDDALNNELKDLEHVQRDPTV